MKTDDIKALLEKYYSGETSLEEERALRSYFLDNQVPPDLENEKQLFLMYDQAGRDIAPEFDYPGKNQKPEAKSKSMPLPWYYAVAASLALLVAGMAIGLLIGSRYSLNQLTAMQQDIREIKSIALVDRLGAESASERILAAYESSSFDRPDPEILVALINAMAMDQNVNVRIAAADALFNYGDLETVKKAFIQALDKEKDPNLQIRLINMLVSLQEKRALPKLKEIMEDKECMQIVRESAAQGISQLIS